MSDIISQQLQLCNQQQELLVKSQHTQHEIHEIQVQLTNIRAEMQQITSLLKAVVLDPKNAKNNNNNE